MWTFCRAVTTFGATSNPFVKSQRTHTHTACFMCQLVRKSVVVLFKPDRSPFLSSNSCFPHKTCSLRNLCAYLLGSPIFALKPENVYQACQGFPTLQTPPNAGPPPIDAKFATPIDAPREPTPKPPGPRPAGTLQCLRGHRQRRAPSHRASETTSNCRRCRG